MENFESIENITPISVTKDNITSNDDNATEIKSKLIIDDFSKKNLIKLAKWMKLMVIFIVVTLPFELVLNEFNAFSTEYKFLSMVLFVVINIWMILYILRFANKIKSALNTNDKMLMMDAFKNLKYLYRFMGTYTIVIHCFLIYGIITSLISVGTALLNMQ